LARLLVSSSNFSVIAFSFFFSVLVLIVSGKFRDASKANAPVEHAVGIRIVWLRPDSEEIAADGG